MLKITLVLFSLLIITIVSYGLKLIIEDERRIRELKIKAKER
tara:strand:+ start:205 stop:330 length:126 start_codon:yes stop_codon:yes gene_type:complete